MSWQDYVNDLMRNDFCLDAAVVGYTCNKSVWAAHAGGFFKHITPEEIDVIIGSDRSTFFTNGLTLGSKKCSVIRDQLFDDSLRTMDLRIKMEGEEGTCCICVARAQTALVLAMGKSGTHAGCVTTKTCKIADYLKECNF